MSVGDPSRFGVYPATQRPDETAWRRSVQDLYAADDESDFDKLATFAKFVPRQTLTRFLARYEAFKLALHTPGIVVEAGVLMGQGLFTWGQLSAIFEPLNHTARIVGFDLFEAADCEEELRRAAAVFDANRQMGHIPKIELVRGNLVETAPRYIEENPHTVVRLLNLDANAYEPTAAALDAFYPRMPKGGVIVFDEINAPPCPGETQAVIDKIGINNLTIRRFPWDSYLSYAVVA